MKHLIRTVLALVFLAGPALAQINGGYPVTTAVGVQSATVNGYGHLIITRTDGSTLDAGAVVGSAGQAGAAGAAGAAGPQGPAGPAGPAGSSAPTGFSRSVYTTSGAISLTDTLSILNGPSGTLAMTLANGTTDGQTVLIMLLGAANATVTANIDGTSQGVAMTASAAGTLKDALRLRWSSGDATWLAE